MDHNEKDIVNYFYNSVRFPEFYEWWESLTVQKREWILDDLQNIFENIAQEYVEETVREEYQKELEKKYSEGIKEGYEIAIQDLKEGYKELIGR